MPVGSAWFVSRRGQRQGRDLGLGCQGQLGDQQVLFNRYSLFVVEGKMPFASANKLTAKKSTA